MQTNLKVMRRVAGFKSARAFAEHIGMSPNTYTAYEQGRITLTADKLWELADALDCTTDDILGRVVPNAPTYADARQEDLNADFLALSDMGRDAAGSVRGILDSERARAVRDAADSGKSAPSAPSA